MKILHVIPQLRTTDLAASIRFYTEQLGFTLDFRYADFYAGVRAGGQVVHLKLVDTAIRPSTSSAPASISISIWRPTMRPRSPSVSARTGSRW